MEKRYNAYSEHLKQKFGAKVYKITLDAGFSCPNRDGTISNSGCIFCDDSGSFSQAHSNKLSIEELESIAGGEGGKKKIYRVDGYTKQGIHIKIDFNNYDGAMHLCKALKLSLDCIKVVYV